MEGRQRRSFTEDYKRQAVDLVASSGRSIGSVARELGLRDFVLLAGGWSNVGPGGSRRRRRGAPRRRRRSPLEQVPPPKRRSGSSGWISRPCGAQHLHTRT